jgi:hypothetical protein
MKCQSTNNLEKELSATGAGSSEVRALTSIAKQLGHLRTATVAGTKRSRKVVLSFGLAVFTGTMLLLVISAHNVLPGSVLYPVQKTSDNIAIAIHPSYRASVMMRRAEQVKTLVTEQAPTNTILATLDDYQHQAVVYKAGYVNYEVFEHCKASLSQAAKQATNPERQAINDALVSLQNV